MSSLFEKSTLIDAKCQHLSALFSSLRVTVMALFQIASKMRYSIPLTVLKEWQEKMKLQTRKYRAGISYFQILWKSRCNIFVSFPSHLKKLHSILRFWLEKLNCGFFHSFHSRKNTTKQLFHQNFSVENNYFALFSIYFALFSNIENKYLVEYWNYKKYDIAT